jgi:hypothetical protein
MAKNEDQQPPSDAGVEQVQQQVQAEDEQGYIGFTPDPTPNENYTFAGRAAGAPVPETDPELARQAREASVLGQ